MKISDMHSFVSPFLSIGFLFLNFSCLSGFATELYALSGEDIPSVASSLFSYLPRWFQLEVVGQEVWQWFALLLGFILMGLWKRPLRWALGRVMQMGSRSSVLGWQKVLGLVQRHVVAISSWLLMYTYLTTIGYSAGIMSHFTLGIKIIIALHVYRACYKLTGLIPELLTFLSAASALALEPVLIALLEKVAKVLVVVLVPLIILQNLGVNVASVLAGLGLGGLAFALAAKDSAANMFGSLMIVIDKPFKIGDWVIIGGNEGTVEEIGLRSTRIRTFYDSVISVPNAEVIKDYVDNMGSRNHRRIKTTLGITYDTTPDVFRSLLGEIKHIIASHPKSQVDGDHHVVFTDFSTSSLDIMLYFFIDVKDWTEELAVRQEIFLDIMGCMDKWGVSFAFPTRTLHLQEGAQHSLQSEEHEST